MNFRKKQYKADKIRYKISLTWSFVEIFIWTPPPLALIQKKLIWWMDFKIFDPKFSSQNIDFLDIYQLVLHYISIISRKFCSKLFPNTWWCAACQFLLIKVQFDLFFFHHSSIIVKNEPFDPRLDPLEVLLSLQLPKY